jgi:hypothetical protein
MHQSLDDELIHAQDKHTGNFVVMIHAYVGSSLARRTRASTVSCVNGRFILTRIPVRRKSWSTSLTKY